MSGEKSKKAHKILLIIALCLIAVFILSLVVNSVIARSRRADIEGAYGEYYQTSNGRINYSVIGDKGDTIVILPGQGSVSPHYEFLSLAERLAESHKIIIIEPLGYGLSDDTDIPRTAENICNEVHEVLLNIGEDRYYLMGHSIAGLYMLQYANMFENELLGVIGLDASVPQQINETNWDLGSVGLKCYRFFLVDTGLLRLSLIGIEDYPEEILDNPAFRGSILQCFADLPKNNIETLAELYCSRAQNSTMITEYAMFNDNCASISNLSFPSSVPVLYILAGESVDSDSSWLSWHQALASNNPKSEVLVAGGNHYVHLSAESEIVNMIETWNQVSKTTTQN